MSNSSAKRSYVRDLNLPTVGKVNVKSQENVNILRLAICRRMFSLNGQRKVASEIDEQSNLV